MPEAGFSNEDVVSCIVLYHCHMPWLAALLACMKQCVLYVLWNATHAYSGQLQGQTEALPLPDARALCELWGC